MYRRRSVSPLHAIVAQVRRSAAKAAVFSFFLNSLVLFVPLYLFQVFDRVLGSGRVETLVALTIVTGFALAIMGMLHVVRSWMLVRIGVWIEHSLGESVVTASISQSLAGRANGTQALHDLAMMRGFVNSSAIYPIFDAPWTPLFIGVVWMIHPWLGIFAIASALVLLFLAVVNEFITRKPLRESGQRAIDAIRHTDQALRNAEIIQAMGMLPAILRSWSSDINRAREGQTRAGQRAAVLTGMSSSLRTMVQVCVLGLGAYVVLQGELTGGGMIAASILVNRALAPVDQLIGAWRSLVSARASYGRLKALLNEFSAAPPSIELPEPLGNISMEKVEFTPPQADEPTLKGISLDVPAGNVLAIMGPSASGKSTLCRLLVGVWPPTSGHIRLDGAEIHSWDRVIFGRHVGYLPQDIELFAGTVRDNIARMNADATDGAVIEAAKAAGVHEMILRLPKGYGTEIGPGGAVLSGGQRQRIGFARAVFGWPKVVVLDEPNSNLDREGAEALVEAIRILKERGTTVILAAHHRSIMPHVDRILLLYRGEMAMLGPRDEVLERLRSAGRAPARLKQTPALARVTKQQEPDESSSNPTGRGQMT